MKLKDEFLVNIINIDYKGNGVARIDNFVIFIKGALLNELIRIKIVEISKRFAIGEIVEIVKESPNRQNIECPYFYKCGGCNFLHNTAEEEIRIKEESIKEMFPEIKINEMKTTNKLNYRNKVTFHIQDNKIGFYEKNTNDIIEIDNCLLLNNNINLILKEIKKLDYSKLETIMIRSTENTEEALIDLVGEINDTFINEITKLKTIKTVYLNKKLIYGNSYIIEEVNNYKYSIYPEAFFQVNLQCMVELYNVISDYAQYGNNLLDLYCGTGTISIYLNRFYHNILGIDNVEQSINNANINLKLNNIKNITYMCKDASFIKKRKFDCVIIDPPRNGLTKKVIENLLDIGANKVIYVSCNIKTLKRDLNLLTEKYEIKEMTPVNMFYRTEHVECIALLYKKY